MVLIEFRLPCNANTLNEWYHEFIISFKRDNISWSENAPYTENNEYRPYIYPFIHYKLTQCYNINISISDVRQRGAFDGDFILMLNEDDYIKLSLSIDCGVPA